MKLTFEDGELDRQAAEFIDGKLEDGEYRLIVPRAKAIEELAGCVETSLQESFDNAVWGLGYFAPARGNALQDGFDYGYMSHLFEDTEDDNG